MTFVTFNFIESPSRPLNEDVVPCLLAAVLSKWYDTAIRGALLAIDVNKKRTATCAPPSFVAQPHINPSHLHRHRPMFDLFSPLYTHTHDPDSSTWRTRSCYYSYAWSRSCSSQLPHTHLAPETLLPSPKSKARIGAMVISKICSRQSIVSRSTSGLQ